MSKKLGDAPIEEEYKEKMNALAQVIDNIFNGENKGTERTAGFILLLFPFGNKEGRCNYISNADREDVIILLKEQLRRFEGMAEAKGTA